jgi:hypothetical protein
MSKGGPEAVDVINEPWAPLQPYLDGNPGPNVGAPPPVNYNWMDWANNPNGVAGGMPSQAPPMSMNDPRMTLEGVYTPVAGGPWGFGLGPGVPTAENGIPNGPGQQFVPPGGGFTPGPTTPENALPPTTGGGQGAVDPAALARAQEYMRAFQLSNGMHDGGGSINSLDALAWAQGNPDANPFLSGWNGRTI